MPSSPRQTGVDFRCQAVCGHMPSLSWRHPTMAPTLGLVPRTDPFWARLLHRCYNVRPMTVRISPLGSWSRSGCPIWASCKRSARPLSGNPARPLSGNPARPLSGNPARPLSGNTPACERLERLVERAERGPAEAAEAAECVVWWCRTPASTKADSYSCLISRRTPPYRRVLLMIASKTSPYTCRGVRRDECVTRASLSGGAA
eukprot:1194474-Prorocentrum_minimum.AAC.1